jgi:hypothetical protein
VLEQEQVSDLARNRSSSKVWPNEVLECHCKIDFWVVGKSWKEARFRGRRRSVSNSETRQVLAATTPVQVGKPNILICNAPQTFPNVPVALAIRGVAEEPTCSSAQSA